MKRNWRKWALAAILLGAALILAALALTGFDYRKLDVTEAVPSRQIAQNYAAFSMQPEAEDAVCSIVVHGGSQSIRVEPSDSDRIELEYTDSGLYHWEVGFPETHVLEISLHSGLRWFDFIGMHAPKPHDLTIRLPAGAELNMLWLETTSGDISVRQLPEVDQLWLQSDSGDVCCAGSDDVRELLLTVGGDWTLQGMVVQGDALIGFTNGAGRVEAMRADSMRMKGSSGDWNLSDVEVSGAVCLETGSGAGQVDSLSAESLYVASTAGNLRLENVQLQGTEDKASDGETGKGEDRDVEAALQVAIPSGKSMDGESGPDAFSDAEPGVMQATAVSGEVFVQNVSSAGIIVETDSGAIEIQLPDAQSAYRIEAQSTGGDVDCPNASGGAIPVCAQSASGDIRITCAP